MVERYMPDGTPPGIGPETGPPIDPRGGIDPEAALYRDKDVGDRFFQSEIYKDAYEASKAKRFPTQEDWDEFRKRSVEDQVDELWKIQEEARTLVRDRAIRAELERRNEIISSMSPEERQIYEEHERESAELRKLGKNTEAEDRELQMAIMRGTNESIIERYKRGEMDRVVVHSEYGTALDYFIPKELNEKVRWMRGYLNQIEETIVAEGRPTQRLLMQELFSVLPVLQADPNNPRIGTIRNYLETENQSKTRWKDKIKPLGEVMDQEFWRTFHLHQFYVAYYNAGDVNTAGQAIGNMYSYQRNFLLKDSNVAYTLKTPDSGPATEAGERTNLQIKRFYRMYDNRKRAFEFLSKDEKGQNELRDSWIKDVANEMKNDPRFALSEAEIDEAMANHSGIYIDLKFALTKAERLWEMDLRRHKHDVMRSDDRTPIPDQATAKRLGIEGKLDYLSAARNGNFPVRRAFALKNRLYTQGQAQNFNLDLIDNVDFWNLDLLSVLPGELESDYRDKLDAIYFKNKVPNHFRLAQENAIKLVEAVTGLKKQGVKWDKDRNARFESGEDGSWPRTNDSHVMENDWTWTEENYIDSTGMVWRWEDFNEINDKEFLEFDGDKKYNLAERRRVIDSFTESMEVDPEIKAFVQGLKDDGFIDYNYKLQLPVARVFRHLIPQESIRSEFEGKQDSYLKLPNEEKLIAMDQMLHFMAGFRYGPVINLVANFFKDREKKGLLKGAFETDLDATGIAARLNLNTQQMIDLWAMLDKRLDLQKPLKYILSYTGLRGAIGAFFRETIIELLQEIVKPPR